MKQGSNNTAMFSEVFQPQEELKSSEVLTCYYYQNQDKIRTTDRGQNLV